MSVDKELLSFIDVVKKLRAPDGCPWDREQTHKSLKPYLIEETYEAIEAIDDEDSAEICEELGDIFLHIVMHGVMGEEDGDFTLEEVIRTIKEKMIRRHPHVFDEIIVNSVGDVWKNWDEIKKKENQKKNKSESILDNVPISLPGLARAEKIQKRAARIGFDWDDVAGAWSKIHEELEEIDEAIKEDDKDKLTEELGDLLFSVVNVSRKLEIDPEEALRFSSNKFMKRFKHIEQKVAEQGKKIKDCDFEELDDYWNQAKNLLKV